MRQQEPGRRPPHRPLSTGPNPALPPSLHGLRPLVRPQPDGSQRGARDEAEASSQLTCWFADDAYRYRVYVKEEILSPDFLDGFRDCTIDHLQPLIDDVDMLAILKVFRRLRTTDETIYMRNGSINRVNGQIGMTFSCDGAHYIDHKTFFEKLDTFATSDVEESMTVCA